jgi:hypothetical protein
MFKRWREQRRLQRAIQIEIIETLCSICLYLTSEGRYSHNRYADYMQGHFSALKTFSRKLRDEEYRDDTK